MDRLTALALLVCAGCYHPTVSAGAPCTDDDGCPSGQLCVGGFCGGTDASAGSDADIGVVDAPPDAPLCQSFNAHFFDACAIPQPTGDLNLGTALADYTWDTTGAGTLKGKMGMIIPVPTMAMAQTGGPTVLVASVNNFTLAAGVNLDVLGTKPLLLVVWGTATINGFVDASADFGTPGPGGNPQVCGTSTGAAGQIGPPASGGVGGGLQGQGGRGGNIAGTGGAPVVTPALIRGGCGGGVGGTGTGTAAARGAGGGAIQIAALDAIDVGSTGTIHVGGGGGAGGTIATGGGGAGGSGGYIGLEAPTVSITGVVAANGGGGGGGASDVAVGSGGGDGHPNAGVAAGGAGAATSNIGACTAGGNGSVGATLTGVSGQGSTCGGGGGGGGAGYIVIWAGTKNTSGGTISPPYTTGP